MPREEARLWHGAGRPQVAAVPSPLAQAARLRAVHIGPVRLHHAARRRRRHTASYPRLLLAATSTTCYPVLTRRRRVPLRRFHDGPRAALAGRRRRAGIRPAERRHLGQGRLS
eukprot:6201132-Pleurochrysis_carterae.AAC.2